MAQIVLRDNTYTYIFAIVDNKRADKRVSGTKYRHFNAIGTYGTSQWLGTLALYSLCLSQVQISCIAPDL